ncbi:hypothetical protein Lal_00032521 [Lupinus albus]|nr:hypothetical protein Lal_00032521 [Lupinus albus]
MNGEKIWVLTQNVFSGSIPLEIGLLRSLTTITLYLSNLTGNIPKSIEKLTNLSYLNVRDDKLFDPIPREIGKLIPLLLTYPHDKINRQRVGIDRLPSSASKNNRGFTNDRNHFSAQPGSKIRHET